MSTESAPMKNAMPSARKLHVLYHELRPSGAAYAYATTEGLFRKHVNLYAGLLAAMSPVTPVITFDDGHDSDFTLAAPILASRGLTAHFFITVGWTSTRPGYMGWPQIRALQQAGHSIGAHSWSHTFLTRCTATQLETELRHARLTLEDHLGVPVRTMSLPGGRANRRVLDACRTTGYDRVFTSRPRSEPLPLGFTVGRLNVRGDMQPDWLAQLFSPSDPLLARIALRHRIKSAAQAVLGDRLYARLWAMANRQEAGNGPGTQPGYDGSFHGSRQEPDA